MMTATAVKTITKPNQPKNIKKSTIITSIKQNNQDAKTAKYQQYAPKNLSEFQQDFGEYLRQQGDQAFATVPKRVSQLYQSLIFNNIQGFLNQCFPVCQSLIEQSHWHNICLDFFAHHSCHSPYFTDINQSFVDYLATDHTLERLNLPAYFAELAHYEWVELMVDIHTNTKPTLFDDLSENQAQPHCVQLNPTLQNLHYQWAVHTISVDEQPKIPIDTFLLVFRNSQHTVKFMEINAMTYALLAFIEQNTHNNLDELLANFAKTIQYPDVNALINFAKPLLADLLQQEVLLDLVD